MDTASKRKLSWPLIFHRLAFAAVAASYFFFQSLVMQRFYTNIQVHKYILWYLLIISGIVISSIIISFNHIFTLILQLFTLLFFEGSMFLHFWLLQIFAQISKFINILWSSKIISSTAICSVIIPFNHIFTLVS